MPKEHYAPIKISYKFYFKGAKNEITLVDTPDHPGPQDPISIWDNLLFLVLYHFTILFIPVKNISIIQIIIMLGLSHLCTVQVSQACSNLVDFEVF